MSKSLYLTGSLTQHLMKVSLILFVITIVLSFSLNFCIIIIHLLIFITKASHFAFDKLGIVLENWYYLIFLSFV